ncbi:IclR family transcriptional regulator [Rhodococcus sp. Eu-32]|uniref:IclR family transcriptional regulator n=1 Tax=Rhodococcoides kyotonense TaxID=398843 RepID=A0A177YKI3_9NOCA|nr:MULTISPECIES: IclR family transcriptional regulator [Rhodococcus]OAK55729.1 IclR family transcriptional regulator [Rhodococcus kyotonensis]RRQ27801.1 IclR family transcriptional regulator [Rhodococcus sp. Eu-32]
MAPTPNVIARSTALMRAVGAAEPAGASTTDLARVTGLARPTAHRLLSSLTEEGFLDRDSATGRWSLGPEMYLLGSAAASRYDITGPARGVVHRLAEETGESAFLSTRRGNETVCLLREDGSFPLRSHVLYEGLRLPLGVASAGLVILAHLPDREIDEYLRDADLVPEWGAEHAPDAIRRRISSTRETGYAVNPALLVEGSWGIGAAVFDRSGRPAWALSLTGVETRFRPERHHELGAILLAQAHRLTGLLRPGR